MNMSEISPNLTAIPPNLDTLLATTISILELIEDVLEKAINKLGYHRISGLVIYYIIELIKKEPQNRSDIINWLFIHVFRHLPPIVGIQDWMGQPNQIIYIHDMNIFLHEVKDWITLFDQTAKYNLMIYLTHMGSNLDGFIKPTTIGNGYLFLTWYGYQFHHGEEIVYAYYDEFTNKHVCITTIGNCIIG